MLQLHPLSAAPRIQPYPLSAALCMYDIMALLGHLLEAKRLTINVRSDPQAF